MNNSEKTCLTCEKRTSCEGALTQFFKNIEIEVPYQEGEDWHVCGEEYQEPTVDIYERDCKGGKK